MKESREKGFCYNCDEKYLAGHRCKTRRLYLLDGNEVENEDTGLGTELIEEETGESETLKTKLVLKFPYMP